MESNELMIGDWYAFRGHPYKCTASDIASIAECEEKGAQTDISEIPITPEILEKNGFKFDGSGQCSMMFLSEPRFSEGQRFNIYVGLKHKTIEVFVAHPIEKSPNWRKTNKAYLEVCGPYVHELQHCLKLVGIDKEIEL